MSKAKQEPVDHVRDRKLSIAIWKNATKDGEAFYSISPTQRREKNDAGEYQNFTSLSGTQILQSQRLQGQAYARIRELEAADYATANPAPAQG